MFLTLLSSHAGKISCLWPCPHACTAGTEEERFNACLGVIRATVSLETFASKAISSLLAKNVVIDLSDTHTNMSAAMAGSYARFDAHSGQQLEPNATTGSVAQLERYFLLGTRTWLAVFHATDALYKSHQSFAPYTVLIALALLTVSACIGTCQRHCYPLFSVHSSAVCFPMLQSGFLIFARALARRQCMERAAEDAKHNAITLLAQTARKAHEKTLRYGVSSSMRASLSQCQCFL